MTNYSTATYTLEEEAWWVQRWVDLLNSYRFKKRLERGRIYAREGHILSLEYKGAKVTALVQGTAEEPYKLSIWLDAFSDEDWNYVIDSLSEQAIYSAQLLAGEMPADIESVFTANGLSLYPFNLAEVHSKCSCPDPKNPCKHIAAVYYQLGDFFERIPSCCSSFEVVAAPVSSMLCAKSARSTPCPPRRPRPQRTRPSLCPPDYRSRPQPILAVRSAPRQRPRRNCALRHHRPRCPRKTTLAA